MQWYQCNIDCNLMCFVTNGEYNPWLYGGQGAWLCVEKDVQMQIPVKV